MTTLAKTAQPLYAGKKCTYAGHLELPDDGYQYEIIKGVMHVVPAPFYRHQALVTALAAEIYAFLKKHVAGIVCVAPRDIKLAEDLKYQPDILFVAKERLGINREEYVDGAPDWIIEVLSRGTTGQDTREKFHHYEQYGVREYWIMDPRDIQSSEFYVLKQGRYEQFHPQGTVIRSKILKGFALDLSQL